MAKTDTVRQTDLQSARASGGAVYLRGGAGGVSNADTVDGYHAAAVPTAGRLLALDAAARFPTSVIDWASVTGVGLQESPADKLAVKLDTNSGLAVSASGLKLSFGGGNPTTIEPDDSAAGGSQPYAARADHQHAIAAAAPTSSLTVTSANAEGNATSFARSNHTHAITSSSNPGASASILASSAQGYLQLVRLGLGVAPSYPLQVQGTTPQLRLQQDASNYADFEVAGDGDLTIQPSGDSLLVPSGKTLASSNWISQTTGWGIYPESTYGRDGYADFRYIYADELHVKAFVTDLEQALAGGQIISKSVAIIAEDFVVPVKGDGAVLTVEDLPGTTAYVFATGDWVRIRNISRSGGGLVVADAYGTVTQVSQNGDGTQTYAFWRADEDTGSAAAGTVVLKGGLALDYGTSGSGYWEVTTLDPAGSPYAQVATWETHPQNLTVHARLGNLDGIAGIGAEWGLWAGRDPDHWVKVSDAGAEIKGLKQTWIDSGGNTRGMVDPEAGAGDYLFWLGPSSGDKRFAVTGAGTVYIGSVPSQNVAGWAHASDLTKIDGGDIYANTVTASALTAHGQNLLGNGGFETGELSDWSVSGGSPVIVTDNPHSGRYYLRVTANNTNLITVTQRIWVEANRNYYMGGWARYGSATTGSIGFRVMWYDAADNYLGAGEAFAPGSSTWARYDAVVTAPSTARYGMFYPTTRDDVPSGTVVFDDCEFYAADGMVLVGTPAGARVEINNAGIEGYSDATTKQFYLRTSDGRAMFGEGNCVLDSGGLRMDSDRTTIQTYNSIEWRTDPTNPASTRGAYISSGLYYSGAYPDLRLYSNPDDSYASSRAELRAHGSAPASVVLAQNDTWALAELDANFGPSTGLRVSLNAFASNPYISFGVQGTDVFQVWPTELRSYGDAIFTGNSSWAVQLTRPAGSAQYIAYCTNNVRRWGVGVGDESETGSNAGSNFWIRRYHDNGNGIDNVIVITRSNGNAWFVGDVSAASFTDRTPYPDRNTALAAVRSLRQAKGTVGRLDHSALHEYVRATDEKGEVGRNLSATVSAQNVVIQELLQRIEQLETERRVS